MADNVRFAELFRDKSGWRPSGLQQSIDPLSDRTNSKIWHLWEDWIRNQKLASKAEIEAWLKKLSPAGEPVQPVHVTDPAGDQTVFPRTQVRNGTD